MSCEWAHLDGAYVLGSLAPTERLAFEQHLAACDECSRNVRELAGLPGLLAQVDPAHLEPEGVAPEPNVPPTLLPALVREAHSVQRRRTFAVAAAAAAVVALLGGGAVATTQALSDSSRLDARPAPTVTVSLSATPSPSASSGTGLPMTPLRPTSMTADLLMTPVAWGTRLDMSCAYEATEGGYEGAAGPQYALVVGRHGGGTEQVATWRGLPGRRMQLSAATATEHNEIAWVEVRTEDGTPLLRLAG